MGKFNYTTSITGHRSASVRRAIYHRSSPKDCCQRQQYRMGKTMPVNVTLTPISLAESEQIVSDPIIESADSITSSNKRKILCLHGGRQSTASFRVVLTDLINELSEFEFVFAETPEEDYVWIRDPPGGKGQPTTDPKWVYKSITYLNDFVKEQGPFYGILGYSQGSVIAVVYLAYLQQINKKIPFKKVILFYGYFPTTHEGLIDSISNLNSEIPILKILGKQDIFYQGGKDLYNLSLIHI